MLSALFSELNFSLNYRDPEPYFFPLIAEITGTNTVNIRNNFFYNLQDTLMGMLFLFVIPWDNKVTIHPGNCY